MLLPRRQPVDGDGRDPQGADASAVCQKRRSVFWRAHLLQPSQLEPPRTTQDSPPKLRDGHASHPGCRRSHGVAIPGASRVVLGSRERRQGRRGRRRGGPARHRVLLHRRRGDDGRRGCRGVPHDGAEAAPHGLACSRQRVGHQRPRVGGSLWRRHDLRQGLPWHRGAVGGWHRLGGMRPSHDPRDSNGPQGTPPLHGPRLGPPLGAPHERRSSGILPRRPGGGRPTRPPAKARSRSLGCRNGRADPAASEC